MRSFIKMANILTRVSALTTRLQYNCSFYSSSVVRKVCSEPFLFHPFRLSSFSTAIEKPSSDKRVGGIIQSKLLQIVGVPVPDGFSFEIIDNPDDETISLQKNFADETINILVYNPDDDGQGFDGEKSSGMLKIFLIVTVVKGDGPCMEFRCRVFHDNVKIERMLIKGPADSSEEIPYEGPVFSDLDDDLQTEFHNYLETRGIESSLAKFLQLYMANKDNNAYLVWLKNIKRFIEK